MHRLSRLTNDFVAVFDVLKTRDAWIFIGVALAFGILGGISLYYATGLDFALQLRHAQKISCASASDAQSAAIIFGGTAFMMAGMVALGELTNYADDRRRRRQVSSRGALIGTIVAFTVGAGLLWLLVSICS